MKKKYLKDKNKKVSYEERKKYCLEFGKHLESLFDPLGEDKREFKNLNVGDFFIDDSIDIENENSICFCEKLSEKRFSIYYFEYKDHESDKNSINKLYLRLKELGK